MAALEMVVAEDGTAYDGKVCVGTKKIVRELLDKIKQLLVKVLPVNLHGDMLAVEDDAVLVVIDIGGVLKAPLLCRPCVSGMIRWLSRAGWLTLPAYPSFSIQS